MRSDDGHHAASAGAQATACWRKRKARGSFVVPVELFAHEVDALVRHGLLAPQRAASRSWIGLAVGRLVQRVFLRAGPRS